MRERVRGGQVGHFNFDILQTVLLLQRSLMLVQQSDAADQRKVFHMVAACARAITEERQLLRKRVHNMQRFQESLCISVDAKNAITLNLAFQPVEGFRFALQVVDCLRLLA